MHVCMKDSVSHLSMLIINLNDYNITAAYLHQGHWLAAG